MAETAGIQVAESSGPRKARKALSHLEIHPRLGGGHIVRHVYSGYQHEPKEVNFGKEQGREALLHVAKHAGLPATSAAPEAEESEDVDA